MPGSLREKTGGESLNIKRSTISHMAAVHPGHTGTPGALQKEEEEAILHIFYIFIELV